MKNQLKLSLILSCLVSIFAQASSLSDVEMKLRQQIDNNLSHAAQLLETSVNINSGTMNFAGVKAVGDLFAKELTSIGFTTQWIDGKEFDRAGHLVASMGSGDLKILMIGHLDTVFAIDDAFQKFSPKDQRFIAGPGITDMKGGDVIIIETVRALQQLNLFDKLSIKIVMTGDEEKSGHPLSLSKKALIEAAQWADIALGYEDGDGDIKTAVTARRGAISWNLQVTGKAAHSSQIFREDIGYGAVYETARILNSFREVLSKEELLTVNPGLIIGGTSIQSDVALSQASAFGKANVIAKTATVSGDIRALSPQQENRAKKLMLEIVANNLPHTSAQIVFDEGYPSMAPTEGNQQLLESYSQVSQDLGYQPVSAVNPRRAGAADISFAANHVTMALDGLGLMGDGGHTKDEIADMQSFAKNIHKSAILIYRLAQNN